MTVLLVDMRRSGLPCRSAGGCHEVFYPVKDTLPALQEAATRRNEHEVSVHSYTHVVLPTPPTWDFSAAMTNRGRSALRRMNART